MAKMEFAVTLESDNLRSLFDATSKLVDYLDGFKEYQDMSVGVHIQGSQLLSRSESSRATPQPPPWRLLVGDELMNSSLGALDISGRARNPMNQAGIATVYDLVHCQPNDLLALTNFGDKCLEEVMEALGKLNLSLLPPDADGSLRPVCLVSNSWLVNRSVLQDAGIRFFADLTSYTEAEIKALLKDTQTSWGSPPLAILKAEMRQTGVEFKPE